jgi:hypothetical protein
MRRVPMMPAPSLQENRPMIRAIVAAALFCAAPAFGHAATNADLAWLEGAWEGEGIDGAPATEVYSRAAGGSMIGHFRQLQRDGSPMFYELITIGDVGGTITYSLKHFNPDLTGWEEKTEVRRFPLTAAKGDRWEFSGLVYERTGRNSMTVSVPITGNDGKTETLTFRFRRKR